MNVDTEAAAAALAHIRECQDCQLWLAVTIEGAST